MTDIILRRWARGLFVAPDGHQFSRSAARRLELDGDHAWIADDLAALCFDFLGVSLDVFDFDGEVMDARSFARRLRFRRLRAVVVFNQREIHRAVGQMP